MARHPPAAAPAAHGSRPREAWHRPAAWLHPGSATWRWQWIDLWNCWYLDGLLLPCIFLLSCILSNLCFLLWESDFLLLFLKVCVLYAPCGFWHDHKFEIFSCFCFCWKQMVWFVFANIFVNLYGQNQGEFLLNLVALPYFFHGKNDEWRCFLIFVDPQLLNSVPPYRRCGSHFQATRRSIDHIPATENDQTNWFEIFRSQRLPKKFTKCVRGSCTKNRVSGWVRDVSTDRDRKLVYFTFLGDIYPTDLPWLTRTIHVWYIYLYLPLKSTSHVGKYTIHGSYGHRGELIHLQEVPAGHPYVWLMLQSSGEHQSITFIKGTNPENRPT